MLKSATFAFALSLLVLAHDAGARPHASFSHGFSSHASSAHVSPPAPARAPSGSFGSFRGAAAPAQKSESALSQQLGKNASQAKALQTLDQRNAAKTAQAAQHAPQPAPNSAQAAPAQPAGAPAPAPASGPSTVVVHQDGGGLGHVIAGAMIARSMNAHARTGYYPGPGYNGPAGQAQSGAGTSFFHLLVTLLLLALIAWGLWFAWRGIRRRRAALRDANKPNYSFERN